MGWKGGGGGGEILIFALVRSFLVGFGRALDQNGSKFDKESFNHGCLTIRAS